MQSKMAKYYNDPARIQETQRVWANVYGRPLTEEEAIEILISVQQWAKALSNRVRQ